MTVEGTLEAIQSENELEQLKQNEHEAHAVEKAKAKKEKVNSSGGAKTAPVPNASPVTRAAKKAQPKIEVSPRDPVEINIRTLLQAGVHFGHQTSRRNPKMNAFIHSSRNGIHIINLPKTVQLWNSAREKIVEIVADGGSVLFVGTKKQAQHALVEEAIRCGAYYVSERWLGGMLTNFQTIKKSIERLNKVEQILEEEELALTQGVPQKFTKKERLMMTRERDKLNSSLGGIREMNGAPKLLFVVDLKRENIAINEAHRLDIPVVALVDTNCDPTIVHYPIASNDDGTRAIRLFCEAVADAVLEGKKIFTERGGEEKLRKLKEEEEKRERARAEKEAALTASAEAEQPSIDASASEKI
jgi:small subunit ribosomal protein S2